jgi:hypothetical protein
MANGGPATKGAEVGGAAPSYRKKSEGRTTTQDKKLKTVGPGGLAGKGQGTTGYKGKARVKKPIIQTKTKAAMPGKRRSG